MRNNITIKDISKGSNVSISTVSRVLNGLSEQYRISKETEEIVKKVAKKLNYRPNQTAINLRLKKTNSIGLIVPNLANPFFSTIASVVVQELRKKGYSVILTDSGENEKTERKELELLIDRRIDGLLVIPSGNHFDHLESVYKSGVPIICVDRYFEGSAIPFVSSNNYKGAYDLTRYLISCGHKRIACIQGVNHVMTNIQRVNGHKDAMSNAGIPIYYIGGVDFSEENGYLETKLLFQQDDPPTAIFGLSDTIILGAIKAIKEEGLSIPENVSVVTFDNSIYLDYLAPAVTSVVQPITEIAQISIKILVDKIEKMHPEIKAVQEKILLQPKIIFRESVTNI